MPPKFSVEGHLFTTDQVLIFILVVLLKICNAVCFRFISISMVFVNKYLLSSDDLKVRNFLTDTRDRLVCD